MKELSLNILDISENSVKAGATLVEILITETDSYLQININDDGCGMSEETLKQVVNPFYTTRTTRRVGMGIPLFKEAAELSGGGLTIASRHKLAHPDNHGTEICATFLKNDIDFTPLGDIVSTLTTLIQGHADIDFLFIHKIGDSEIRLDTRELREVLDDVPLDSFEVLLWIRDNLNEQYSQI